MRTTRPTPTPSRDLDAHPSKFTAQAHADGASARRRRRSETLGSLRTAPFVKFRALANGLCDTVAQFVSVRAHHVSGTVALDAPTVLEQSHVHGIEAQFI